MSYGVILFNTTALAMKTERLLTGEGCSVTVVPAPRQFSASASVALRFPWSQVEAVKQILQQAEIENLGMHEIQG